MLYTKLGGNFPTKIKACIFSSVLHVEFLPNKVYSVNSAQNEGIQMYHSFKRSTKKYVIIEDSSFKHDCTVPTEIIQIIILNK